MIFLVAIDRIRLTISHKYLAIWPLLFVCIFVGCLILDCGVLEKPIWVITSQSIADIFLRWVPNCYRLKNVSCRPYEKIGTKKIIWKDHWSIHLEVLLWYDFTQYFFTWKAEWREEGELGKKFFSRKKKNTTVDSKRDLSARGVFKAFNSAPLICNSKVTFASYDKLTTNTILIF